MGYTLEAFIAHGELLRAAAAEYQRAPIVFLPQEFAMLLNTDEFHDKMQMQNPLTEDDPYAEFWKLSPVLSFFASKASMNGPIAYLLRLLGVQRGTYL